MISLPSELEFAIQQQLKGVSLKEITQARITVSEKYKDMKRESNKKFIVDEPERLSYLVTRMPATYAVVYSIFQELLRRLPTLEIKNLLDLGAGPGTVAWTAISTFPNLEKMVLIEQDPLFIDLGKKLIQSSSFFSNLTVEWQKADITQLTQTEIYDLVISSYAIGELSDIDQLSNFLDQAWERTRKVLIVIAPGTPRDFERINLTRDLLLARGGFIIAPCPHSNKCPMSLKKDWCHFAQRVERSDLHRILKDAELSFEDEKYSYLIFSKVPQSIELEDQSRVLRHPLRKSGHTILDLCSSKGYQREVVSKKQGERYKNAKKIEWGDLWSYPL